MFSRNQVFCLKNWNFWRAPTTLEFNLFLLNFCTRFLRNNAYVFKWVFGIFFLYCLDLEWLLKIKKDLVSTHSQKQVFYIFINILRSQQNKKNIKHHFEDIVEWEACANFQQKVLRNYATFNYWKNKICIVLNHF